LAKNLNTAANPQINQPTYATAALCKKHNIASDLEQVCFRHHQQINSQINIGDAALNGIES